MDKIVIVGAGKTGKRVLDYIKKRGGGEVLFYDNDRRLWGGSVSGIRVINFLEFLEIASQGKCKIIDGTNSKTAMYFIKDVCGCYENVYKFDENCLVKVAFKEDEKFDRDIESLEYENILICKEKTKRYAKGSKAYEHGMAWLDFKQKHIMTPRIVGIELTNRCNLACPNCPNPTTKREKGFMNEDVFNLAFRFIPPSAKYFSVHGLGEPLLHPRFLEYIEKIASIDTTMCISTNGLLLDKNLAKSIASILKNISDESLIYVSFHSYASVLAWKESLEIMRTYPNILFYGQILEHNRKESEAWLKDIGIRNPEKSKYIRYITSHSFAGNVLGRENAYHDIEIKNRIRNCYYIKNNIVSVAWNGILKGCCYDSEEKSECGSVFDYQSARTKMEYSFCQHCDPDWTSGFQ